MINKIKTETTATEKAANLAAQIGIVLMSAATTLGMLEIPDQDKKAIIMPSRPAFAVVNESSDNANPLRRERDETMPHYISYAVSQRTPARSGKR